MMKKLIALVLVASLLMAGCQNSGGQAAAVDATKPAAVYDWMAGESPIPVRRSGLLRAGLNTVPFDVTNEGFYYIANPVGSDTNSYILYGDNNSDTVIKLCGRADCTHDTTDCNAYVGSTCFAISYWNGYLYAVYEEYVESIGNHNLILCRMNLDGSNRVVVRDLHQFALDNDLEYAHYSLMTDGYLKFSIAHYEKQPDGSLQPESDEYYYFALDGSMAEPKILESEVGSLYSCGDVILSLGDAQNGGTHGGYYDWHPETDTATFLCDHPGQPGWFGETEAYYFKNGGVYRLTYATGMEEKLFDTGLTGKYYATILPDCIIVASKDFDNPSDKNLYFYNWNYELVDTVGITYPFMGYMVTDAIAAETAERIILTNSTLGRPMYYIEKSELGTGNVKIHSFKLPDMTDAEQAYWEDLEWLNNG